METIDIKVPLWNTYIRVVIGNVTKIIEDYNVNIIPPAVGITWQEDGVVYIGLEDIKHLTHEAAHATFELMRLLGIPNNKSTEEVFAYTQEAIITKIMNKYEKINKGRN